MMKTRTVAYNNTKSTKNTGSNIQRPHIVIAYYQGISESMKKHVVNMECRFTLREQT